MSDKDSHPEPRNIGDRAPSDEWQADEWQAQDRLPSCGDFDIRIARDGTWYYRGSPIRRMPLVKLFSTVLRREDDGAFWLVTPVERGRVEVEDAPFLAVELQASGRGEAQSLRFRTNLDDWVEADAAHRLRVAQNPETRGPQPYILVRDGLEALVVRAVYYQLVDLAATQSVKGHERVGVWSRGQFFPIDEPPDAP